VAVSEVTPNDEVTDPGCVEGNLFAGIGADGAQRMKKFRSSIRGLTPSVGDAGPLGQRLREGLNKSIQHYVLPTYALLPPDEGSSSSRVFTPTAAERAEGQEPTVHHFILSIPRKQADDQPKQNPPPPLKAMTSTDTDQVRHHLPLLWTEQHKLKAPQPSLQTSRPTPFLIKTHTMIFPPRNRPPRPRTSAGIRSFSTAPR
jgi:hypothetical protein